MFYCKRVNPIKRFTAVIIQTFVISPWQAFPVQSLTYSSLLRKSLNYDRKKLYRIGLRSRSQACSHKRWQQRLALNKRSSLFPKFVNYNKNVFVSSVFDLHRCRRQKNSFFRRKSFHFGEKDSTTRTRAVKLFNTVICNSAQL